MAQKLEVEFRVYRTREPGAKKECVATRSIPHALQVWNESVDAYSRSLELVVSGDWLMEQLQSSENARSLAGELDECERVRIAALCTRALAADDPGYKQHCLQEILALLGRDMEATEGERAPTK
jgi:hypothetical protein